jgi:hypothetical protein
MTPELLESVRALMLPIDPAHEIEAVLAADQYLASLGVEEDARASWLRLEYEDWRANGEPSDELSRLVSEALRDNSSGRSAGFAVRYFEQHARLRSEHLLGHDESSAFLSHLLLILQLAEEHRMSAAQITRLLAARDARLTFRWRTVRDVLVRFDVRPRLVLPSVKELVRADAKSEDVFADADLIVAAGVVGTVAERLGFIGDLGTLLLQLCPPSRTPFTPFLQILHFQCLIAEFYDHSVANAYEFSPRGRIVEWLCEQYPSALGGAGNPFLNNAKAVQELDFAWAEGREDNLAEARAVAAILRHMESMGFAARRELAAWLRRWLHRVMRIHEPQLHLLPGTPTVTQVEAVLAALCARESATRGIIEQRVVDALTTLIYDGSEWRSRGLGDSVNATNISSRKLGDADYQHAENHVVEAYEVHAGRVADVYVHEHLRSVAKVIALRADELLHIADLDKWRIQVTFIAHDFESSGPRQANINGVIINVRFVRFERFIESTIAGVNGDVLASVFGQRVHAPLNEHRTPNWVRRAYSAIARAQ